MKPVPLIKAVEQLIDRSSHRRCYVKKGEEEHAFLQNTFAWFGSVCSIPLLSTSRIFLPDEAFYQPLFISEKSVPGKHQNNE